MLVTTLQVVLLLWPSLLVLVLLWLVLLLDLVPPASHFLPYWHPTSSTTTTTTISPGAGVLGTPDVQGVLVRLHSHRPFHYVFFHFMYQVGITSHTRSHQSQNARCPDER